VRSLHPLQGFRFQDPTTARISGLTFVAWLSTHHMYGPRITVDDGSGEDRAASIAFVQSAGSAIPPITQGTDANRPLFGDTVVAGVTMIHTPSSRSCWLASANATLLAVASGTAPAFTLLGVWGGTGVLATPCAWFGNNYDYPLLVNGSLNMLRSGSVVSHKVIFANGSIVAAPVVWCIFRNSDMTQDTFISGEFVSTATHDANSDITMTEFRVFGDESYTPEQVNGELMVWSGVPDGDTAAVRYKSMQRIARSMGSRFGGLAA